VKYEEVYLRAYDSVPGRPAPRLGGILDLYNRRRPHSSLDGMTPDQAYYGAHRLPPIPLGGLTPADVPLIEAGNLSEQPGHLRPPVGERGNTATQATDMAQQNRSEC